MKEGEKFVLRELATCGAPKNPRDLSYAAKRHGLNKRDGGYVAEWAHPHTRALRKAGLIAEYDRDMWGVRYVLTDAGEAAARDAAWPEGGA